MSRIVTILIAIAAFFLVGWYGYRTLVERQSGFPLSEPETVIEEPGEQLPMEPADWQGRIDYRSLDRSFAAVARRPEMAGLAIAIVEDGDLRFVQTYGVTDKGNEEWVMPHTVSAGHRYQKEWLAR